MVGEVGIGDLVKYEFGIDPNLKVIYTAVFSYQFKIVWILKNVFIMHFSIQGVESSVKILTVKRLEYCF